ncbi:MAG: YdcF family protein [Acidobacteriota bacterium]
MLYIKKIIYSFIAPPGIIILFMLLFSLWLYKKRKEKRGAAWLLFLSFVFYIASTPLLGDFLLHSIEYRYIPPLNPSGDVIIMLGGGAVQGSRDVDGVGSLSGSAASRLLTAYQLHQRLRIPVIVCGGQVFSDTANEAEIAQRKLISLGMSSKMIIMENTSRNTAENADNTKDILLRHKFGRPILVTSAYHMPRAVSNFERIGIKVEPYPTDYCTGTDVGIYANKMAPSAGGLSATDAAVHEYLGMLATAIGI